MANFSSREKGRRRELVVKRARGKSRLWDAPNNGTPEKKNGTRKDVKDRSCASLKKKHGFRKAKESRYRHS